MTDLIKAISFYFQAFRAIVLVCALALPMTNAVINTKSDTTKLERREAPFETYGPPEIQPQQQTIVLPTPVYGAPAVAKYPPPPPERPPYPQAPSKEYGKLHFTHTRTETLSLI